ncbi:uncharacterized protein LOC113778820 isoform X2 [Coffea eugenioides]|uniref:Uncharacterized protein isoform X2 n=1 Tax=Coffea arabica TaxID=13443 RepID=A0ABM4V8Y6_COFAR|nr:uncharacterized protein LOC113778820 isoform X2 [Coffea eugenioides]
MLSPPRPLNAIPASISLASSQRQHVQFLTLGPIKSSSDDINGETGSNEPNASTPIQQPIKPPDTVEIRFRRGSRRRRRNQQQDGASMKAETAAHPKDWESMTLTEKVVELYMGEKGLPPLKEERSGGCSRKMTYHSTRSSLVLEVCFSRYGGQTPKKRLRAKIQYA